MKTQYILLSIAGVGLVYYLWSKQKNGSKNTIPATANIVPVNQDEVPLFTTNDIKTIRRNIHKFIVGWHEEFQIEINEPIVKAKVLELTDVKPVSSVQVKQIKTK